MLSSNMLLLNFVLLIDVTFSTPTGLSTQNSSMGLMSDMGDLSSIADPERRHSWLIHQSVS
jgi:hypothetical protein